MCGVGGMRRRAVSSAESVPEKFYATPSDANEMFGIRARSNGEGPPVRVLFRDNRRGVDV